MAKVVRLLTYEGRESFILDTFAHNGVPANGNLSMGNGNIVSTILTQSPEDLIKNDIRLNERGEPAENFDQAVTDKIEVLIERIKSEVKRADTNYSNWKRTEEALTEMAKCRDQIWELEANLQYQTREADKWRNEAVKAYALRDEAQKDAKIHYEEAQIFKHANIKLQKQLNEHASGVFLKRIEELERFLKIATEDANTYITQRNETKDINKKLQADIRKLRKQIDDMSKPCFNNDLNERIRELEGDLRQSDGAVQHYKAEANKFEGQYLNTVRSLKHALSKEYKYVDHLLVRETTKTKEREVEYANTESGKEVCTMAWRCDSCGTKNFGKDRYCRHCGSKFINGNW